MYNLYLETKVEILKIVADDNHLLEIGIVTIKELNNPNDICIETRKQINEYLNNQRTKFELPIKLQGTDFQKNVWQELLKINYHELVTYKELSIRLNNPKAIRAVANAVGANRLLIIIPCHRVIGSNNSMTGFGGGIENKIILLEHEGHVIDKQKQLHKSILTTS